MSLPTILGVALYTWGFFWTACGMVPSQRKPTIGIMLIVLVVAVFWPVMCPFCLFLSEKL